MRETLLNPPILDEVEKRGQHFLVFAQETSGVFCWGRLSLRPIGFWPIAILANVT